MKYIYIHIYEPEEFKKSKFVKILLFLEIKIDVPYFFGGEKKGKKRKIKRFKRISKIEKSNFDPSRLRSIRFIEN